MNALERTLVLLAVWQMPQFAPPKSTQPRLPCSPKTNVSGVPHRSRRKPSMNSKRPVKNITTHRRKFYPHDSYLINLGHPVTEALEKSRDAFIDEMQRCEQLGLSFF